MAQKRPDDKKKQKKKKGHGGLLLLLLLILLLLLLGGLGFGMGWFDGDGEGSGDGDDKVTSSVAKSDEKTEDESSAADKSVVSVTVKGQDYIIDGKTLTLEEVKTELGNYDKETVTVDITDDGAVDDAYKALTGALDELGFKHNS